MKKNQLANAMLEVLISLSIIAFAFLSLFSYQINLLKKTYALNFNAIAIAQLMNFSSMLQVNADDLHRQAALQLWNNDNAALLPTGKGGYQQVSEHDCLITVKWMIKKVKAESLDVCC